MSSPPTSTSTQISCLLQHTNIKVKLMKNASQPAPLSLKNSIPVKNKNNIKAIIRRPTWFFKKTKANNGGITTASKAPIVFNCNTGPVVLGNPETKLKAHWLKKRTLWLLCERNHKDSNKVMRQIIPPVQSQYFLGAPLLVVMP